MPLFKMIEENKTTEEKPNWYELHGCQRLIDIPVQEESYTNKWDKVSHAKRNVLIDTGLNEGLIELKCYMNDIDIYDSPIVETLLRDCKYINRDLGIDLNCALRAITYLYMSYKNNLYLKLPDKKLAYILKTDKQKSHLFSERIGYTMKDYFEVRFNFSKGYYEYKVNKTQLEFDDCFITGMSKYLFYKYLNPINIKSKRMRKRIEQIWKKYNFVEFKKLDKRKELYYENSLYGEVSSRECFKILFIGLSWYYTKLTEQFTTPEVLKNIREINGERQDIYYLENPIFILQEVTNLTGTELNKRINATVGGMGTLLYKHDLSYVNITNPEQEFNPVKMDEYQNLELVKHSKLCKINGQIVKDEAYRASIQGFQTTSFSFIMKPEYFNTKLGKIILENKNIFLGILKKYFLKHRFGDTNYDYYNKIINEKKIKADILPIILSPEQITKLLENELKDIDIESKEIKDGIRKLVNKDKLFGLPIVKARKKRKYSYKDCMKKDKHNKIKTDETKKIILKSPEACTYVLSRILNQISGNDLKANYKINISYGNGKKVFDESTINNINDFLSINKQDEHKKELYNLGYNVNQFKLCREVILERFRRGFKGCIDELKRLLFCIKKFKIGECFIDCKEVKPYYKYIFN